MGGFGFGFAFPGQWELSVYRGTGEGGDPVLPQRILLDWPVTPDNAGVLAWVFGLWVAPFIDPATRLQRALAHVYRAVYRAPFLAGHRSGDGYRDLNYLCGVYPLPPDRRFRAPGHAGVHQVGGFTEPYPLAWPHRPLVAAYAGDLSLLWPYLTP